MLRTFNAVLVDKKQLTHDVFLFKFQLPDAMVVDFIPGQYFILNIPQKDGSMLKRLYSVASSLQDKESFEFLVKIILNGQASDYFHNLNIGEQAVFQGSAGAFILKPNNKDKVFLVTGTGLAPVRSMILTQLQFTHYSLQTTHYFLFWGLPTFQDVYFLREFKELSQKYQNFQFKICLSREKNLEMIAVEDHQYFVLGHVDQGCDDFLNQQSNNDPTKQLLNNFDFYICGSRQVVESLHQYLLDRGVQGENIVFEKF